MSTGWRRDSGGPGSGEPGLGGGGAGGPGSGGGGSGVGQDGGRGAEARQDGELGRGRGNWRRRQDAGYRGQPSRRWIPGNMGWQRQRVTGFTGRQHRRVTGFRGRLQRRVPGIGGRQWRRVTGSKGQPQLLKGAGLPRRQVLEVPIPRFCSATFFIYQQTARLRLF